MPYLKMFQTMLRCAQRPCSPYLSLRHASSGMRLHDQLHAEPDLASCARRKRPFLVRPLENTLIKLLKSLDFYDDLGREKIAIGAALLPSWIPFAQALLCKQSKSP